MPAQDPHDEDLLTSVARTTTATLTVTIAISRATSSRRLTARAAA
ncbi:hypothetical protein ACFXKE_16100 [Streptomyces sp. NPDC059202]